MAGRARLFRVAGVGVAVVVVAAGLFLVRAAVSSGRGAGVVGRVQAAGVTPVASTITVNPSTGQTFAPPPAGGSPALSAAQAYDRWEHFMGDPPTGVPSGQRARLGLVTVPVGRDCGAACKGLIIRGGEAYSALDELAYGYSRSVCPAGSARPADRCVMWTFLDADSGRMIDGVGIVPRVSHPRP